MQEASEVKVAGTSSVDQNDTCGYSEDQWKRAREEMRQILMETAHRRGVIPYSELTQKVNTLKLEPHSNPLDVMLGQISEAEDRAGRGMLTVLVVHKGGDYQPGPGFYDLARDLGRDTSVIHRSWVNELHTVHDYWKRNWRRRRSLPSPW